MAEFEEAIAKKAKGTVRRKAHQRRRVDGLACQKKGETARHQWAEVERESCIGGAYFRGKSRETPSDEKSKERLKQAKWRRTLHWRKYFRFRERPGARREQAKYFRFGEQPGAHREQAEQKEVAVCTPCEDDVCARPCNFCGIHQCAMGVNHSGDHDCRNCSRPTPWRPVRPAPKRPPPVKQPSKSDKAKVKKAKSKALESFRLLFLNEMAKGSQDANGAAVRAFS